jgi:hypothetical protein
MEHPENNKFGYAYVVDDDSDLTPPDDQLEPMDAHLLDHQLLNFMQQTLEGADESFYYNNADIAKDFFGGPIFPQCAVDALGYPGSATNN